jgi:hypothetical protein
MSVESRESSVLERQQTHPEILVKIYLFVIFLLMDRKISAEQIRHPSLMELERNNSIIHPTAQITLDTLDRNVGRRSILFTRKFGFPSPMAGYSSTSFIESPPKHSED